MRDSIGKDHTKEIEKNLEEVELLEEFEKMLGKI